MAIAADRSMIFFKSARSCRRTGCSTTFRDRETGENPCKSATVSLRPIGHTPLIKLERVSAATGCTILGKAEFMNPGGSVKDRPGRQMILEAEKARRAEARRARGRGHRGQHRHWPRSRRQRAAAIAR
jgi:hypothetical protein